MVDNERANQVGVSAWNRAGAFEYVSSLLIAAVAVFFFDAAWTSGMSEWFGGPNAPAWVQAIGSILAIVAAGLSIRWQVGEEGRQQRELMLEQQAALERQRAEDEVRHLQVVASTLFHCRAMLESMRDRAGRNLPIDVELERLTHYADALYTGPAKDVPDARANYVIASTRSTVEVLRQKLSRIDGTRHDSANAIERQLNAAYAYLISHEETVVNCLESRSAEPLHLTYTVSDGSQETLRVLSVGHPEHLGLRASDDEVAARRM